MPHVAWGTCACGARIFKPVATAAEATRLSGLRGFHCPDCDVLSTWSALQLHRKGA